MTTAALPSRTSEHDPAFAEITSHIAEARRRFREIVGTLKGADATQAAILLDRFDRTIRDLRAIIAPPLEGAFLPVPTERKGT